MADGKASQSIRAQAKYWSELYREAQRTPERVVRDPVTGFAVQADDTEFLITLLENFAERGTFAFKPELGLSEMVMALRFSLINKDKNLGAREAELTRNLGISPSNVKRPLSNVKNRLKDIRKSKSVNRDLESFWGLKLKK
jgi:hypothetical protein